MKLRLAIATLLLAGAAGAGAQVVGYNFRSGDVWVDTQLGYFSDYGRRDRAYFVEDLVGNYGAPRYLVNELLDKRRWDPGDVYYAAALAYTARRPLLDVTREYENNKGQGWGVVARNMGIKPGSAEFHALKGSMGKSKGRYDTHGGGPGNSGKGKPVEAGPPGSSGKGKGKDNDPGQDGNSQGKGKDKGGQGKGNKGKGHGH